MSGRRATPGRQRTDAARGACALAGVIALAVAVPAALISWVGWPLPAGVPTADEVATALRTSDISEGFLLKTLALVCWVVWVELMASLLVEAVAYARGREAGRVPGGGGVQRASARLVATVALLGALTTARGAPEAAELVLRPMTSGLGTAAGLAPGDEDGGGAGDGRTQGSGPGEPGVAVDRAEAPAPRPVYEVRWRDTLWGIAETHLGDPFRWSEIFEINRGRAQPDGRRLDDPDLIHPGWHLELPADAVGLPAPGEAPEDRTGGGAGAAEHRGDPEDEGAPATGGKGTAPDAPGARPGSATPQADSGGGMTVLDESPTAPSDATGYAAPGGTPGPGGGMVLLPGEEGDGATGSDEGDEGDEPQPPLSRLPAPGRGDEVASPTSRSRRPSRPQPPTEGDPA